jgi:hypothetical protein
LPVVLWVGEGTMDAVLKEEEMRDAVKKLVG